MTEEQKGNQKIYTKEKKILRFAFISLSLFVLWTDLYSITT